MRINGEGMLWLELALTPEMAPRHLRPLLGRFGCVAEIFAADMMTLRAAGISAGAAAGIAQRAGSEAALREAEHLDKHDIGLIAFDSGSYPPLLRQIPDPPPVLFARGSLVEADWSAVAIVGSRGATAYGTQVAHRLAGDLAARGLTVVSGLARGVDQAAHNGALETGGRTVAVLGSGLARIYPSGCGKLVERICGSGAVITEFSYETPASKATFPQRNRIISGMSHATLVTQASERSGALITARFALEQDRELLAVPGRITARQSVGTNYMIKRGAKLVQRVEDIIDELPQDVKEGLRPGREQKRGPDLGKQEREVMELLSVDTPIHIDIIAGRLGTSTADLSLALLGLEMKNLVRQLPGMEYIKVI